MFWSMEAPATRMRPGAASRKAPQNGAAYTGAGSRIEYLPNTTDWLGRWRLANNTTNDHGIDRQVQRMQSYTGIDGIHLQDQAITESMGAIVDRSIEHLGTSDAMIIRTRRCLIRAAQALRQTGTPPPAVDAPELYRQRSGGVILPGTADWLEATQELRKAFVDNAALVS
jgi:hypothetical protein